MIEFGEASDIYLKTGLEAYWNKRSHKPVSEETVFYLDKFRDNPKKLLEMKEAIDYVNGDIVSAKDAFLEELIDVIFFVVNATHVELEGADLDAAFERKLAYNKTRPKQYGISRRIKAEAHPTVENTKKMDSKRLSAREMKSIAFGETQPDDYAHEPGYSRRDQ